ncbi:MAG: hypothetical protein ACYTEK_21335, partial [Planctomycetota bacterium]
VRPSLDKRSQFGIILQGFVQASGQDRTSALHKFFVFSALPIPACRFEPYSGSFLLKVEQ